MKLHVRTPKSLVVAFLFLIAFSSSFGKTIGISNPTVKNLQRFVYLAEQGMINAGDEELNLVGVFHEDQTALKQKSEDFVQEHGYDWISFVILNGQTNPEALFQDNEWSGQFREIFEATDGFVFNGGPDIPPYLYGEETLLGTGIMETTRLWELSMIAHLLGTTRNAKLIPLLKEREDYLVMGICLGMQEMNVATGGSMYQDIPFELYGIKTYETYMRMASELRHRNDHSKFGYLEDDVMSLQFHPLKAPVPSFLSDENGHIALEITVPSVHHQALKTISEGFEVIAYSLDGKVPEAIQHRRFESVFGIQFHPEISQLYYQQPIQVTNDQQFVVNKASEAFYRSIWAHFSDCLVEQK